MTVLAMVIVPAALFLLGFPVYITLLAAVCVTVVIVMIALTVSSVPMATAQPSGQRS